jgi:hypothetical protein
VREAFVAKNWLCAMHAAQSTQQPSKTGEPKFVKFAGSRWRLGATFQISQFALTGAQNGE